MDYRRFLSAKQTLVLPHFGGVHVEDGRRRLRLTEEVAPGWWSFEIEGRRARAVAPAEPIDLSDRPAVRGHHVAGWLFSSGTELGRIALPPADEPEPLARCLCRRWSSGELLFDSLEFEDEPELRAREALDRGQPVADVAGMAPSLRAAFGFAVMSGAARDAGVEVSPREVAAAVQSIARDGRPGAEALIARLVEEREQEERRRRLAEAARAARTEADRERARARELAAGARRMPSRGGDPVDRADAALRAAGARLLRARPIAGQLEVTFTFMDERFIAMVDAETHQVHDAGICLSGTDREVNLDSLPSVIREAIETGRLNITRR